MPVDNSIKSYARAYLLRADPVADHLMIDAFVGSQEFQKLIGIFERKLEQTLNVYKTAARERLGAERSIASNAATEHNAQPALPLQASGALISSTNTSPMPEELNSQHESGTGEKAKHATDMNSASPTLVTEEAQAERATEQIEPLPLMDLSARDEIAENKLAPTPPASAPPVEQISPVDSNAVSSERLIKRASTVPGLAPVSAAREFSDGVKMPPARAPASIIETDPADITFRLQNARVGEPYAQRIEPQLPAGLAIVYCDITVPQGLLLHAELQNGMLSGTPVTSGEYDVVVLYHFAHQSPSRKRRYAIRMVVNPDPKTMWQNKPSDANALYWKPDEDSQAIDGGEFRILAASKRGRSHAHVGSFRDDDFKIGILEDSKWHLAVVADGAGSSRYSRRGAQLICEEAMKHLTKALHSAEGTAIDQAAEAFYQIRTKQGDAVHLEAARQTLHNRLFVTVGYAAYYSVKAIVEECDAAQEMNAVYKDFSSTALIVACKRYAFGTLVVTYWVGDGAVAIYRKNHSVTLLGDVDSGEFSGQTRFLEGAEVSQEALLKRTRFEIVDDLTSVVLMTDGVSDPKFETEARLSRIEAWDGLWHEIDQAVGLSKDGADRAEKLLAWLDFWSTGNHDDRTIALIY